MTRPMTEHSRQLVASDAAVHASREMAVSAAQNPDLVLRFGVDNLPIYGPDRFSIGHVDQPGLDHTVPMQVVDIDSLCLNQVPDNTHSTVALRVLFCRWLE